MPPITINRISTWAMKGWYHSIYRIFMSNSQQLTHPNQNVISSLISNNLSLPWSRMIFSVSNNGIYRSLELGPDLVVLTPKDPVREMSISSQEFPSPAWNLSSSLRNGSLHKHFAPKPILIPTFKHIKRGMKYSQVYAHKRSPQATIRCPIWRSSSFNGRIMTWTWKQFFDQA